MGNLCIRFHSGRGGGSPEELATCGEAAVVDWIHSPAAGLVLQPAQLRASSLWSSFATAAAAAASARQGRQGKAGEGLGGSERKGGLEQKKTGDWCGRRSW